MNAISSLLIITALLPVASVPDSRIIKKQDIVYAEPASPLHMLDVYASPPAKNAPVVFWIHGGGWQGGSVDITSAVTPGQTATVRVLVAAVADADQVGTFWKAEQTPRAMKRRSSFSQPGFTAVALTVLLALLPRAASLAGEVRLKLAQAVPPAWQMVQVDLWEAFGRKPARIQAMSLRCSGGPAWFDQIRLSQTPEPPAKP